tara:strand:+ start:229 stop:738 length:510 start_codon:yes stop_codon:yes gene_type:complete
MNSFETKIVRTWDPPKLIRAVGIVLLLASAGIIYIWKPQITWLRIVGYIVYFFSFLFALSLSFIKPKNLGEIAISEETVELNYKGVMRSFLISELIELGFNYRGYANYWKHTLYGNKNHLYFTDNNEDKFDFEIILQNKEKKQDLKQFLKRLKLNANTKITQTGNSICL